MFDAFISYSSKNQSTAFDVCQYLESNGLTCWIAPRNVDGGQPYSVEIIEGIKSSQVFVLIVSEASNASKHVLSELDVAFNNDKVIIPFCIDDAILSDSLSYYLTATHRISASPAPADNFGELHEAIVKSIPELAAELERARVLELTAGYLGLSVEELVRIKSASSYNEDGTDDESGQGGKSRYDILRNDKGEVLMIIEQRDKAPDNPLLMIDPITTIALLYRNSKSVVIFNDIAPAGHDSIMRCPEITVCEINADDIVREYTIPVSVVKDVRLILDDDKEFQDESYLLSNQIEQLDTEDASSSKDVVVYVDSGYEYIDSDSVLFISRLW